MSHSDSEIKNDMKSRISKQHQVQFKAKEKIRPPIDLQKVEKFRKEIEEQWAGKKLVDAVNCNNTEEVKRMLEKGVSPNSIDYEMRSALHVAVSRGYADIVELLLKYGADPNKRDLILNTPLHLAACVHNFSIISMLVNAKADVSSLDLHGRNPFQLASSKLQLLQRSCREGTIEMIKLREELKQVVDLLLSVMMRGIEEQMEKMNRTEVDDLQMMRLSLDSTPNEVVIEQIDKLIIELDNLR